MSVEHAHERPRRPSRRRTHRTRRAAMSMVELMIGTMITTLVAAATAAIMFASVNATDLRNDYRNATVIALIRNPYRKNLLEQMGVEHFIDPNDEDWLEQVKALTYENQGPDHSVECSGIPFYQERVCEATRMYGNVNFSGHTPGAKLDFSPLDYITHPGHTFTGQHDVRMRDREGLIRCLMNKDVQRMIDVMVTHDFPMSEAAAAFDVQASKKCGKGSTIASRKSRQSRKWLSFFGRSKKWTRSRSVTFSR